MSITVLPLLKPEHKTRGDMIPSGEWDEIQDI